MAAKAWWPGTRQSARCYARSTTRDGFAGDQTPFSPPFTSTDDDLAEMVSRLAASVRQVAQELETKLETKLEAR